MAEQEKKHTFNISVSEQGFEHKPSKTDYQKMTMEKMRFDDLNSFISMVKDGHAFCANITETKDEPFLLRQKTSDRFDYTQVVTVDIEHTDITPEQFYRAVNLKPTYLYTSFSHGVVEGDNRYHAIYVFEDKIVNKAAYEAVYNKITGDIRCSVGNINIDDSMVSCVQLTNGTNANATCFEDYFADGYKIYTLGEIDCSTCESRQDTTADVECPFRYKIIPTSHILSLSGQFKKDLETLPLRDFVEKYGETYSYQETTNPIYNENHYEILDDTNAEIWSNWDRANGSAHPAKVKQGAHKRFNTLLAHGMVFRKIFPNITDEHLVFCLAADVLYHIENYDGKYNVLKICDIARLCLQQDMSEFHPKHKNGYRVDKSWCIKKGVKPQSYALHVRKIIKDEQIRQYYDKTKSLRENAKIMNEAGLKVGKSRIAQFKKDYGL